MRDKRIQKQNIGNAGEYYIASQLSAMDFVVTITLGRAEKYDILALSPKNKVFKLSVKTKFGDDTYNFPLSEKDESGASNDFYYAFVRLNELKSEPDFWIIPSRVVSALISKAHKVFAKSTNKDGSPRAISNLRALPIMLHGAQKEYYPKSWERDMDKYYKNIRQLL